MAVEVHTEQVPAGIPPVAPSVKPVVCLGEVMAQIVPTTPASRPQQPIQIAETFSISAAGAESNVALSLARIGTPAMFVGFVGDDPLGRRIRTQLISAGVDVRLLSLIEHARTGLFLKDPAPTGSRVHYYRDSSAATAMSSGDLDSIFALRPRWLHTSGVTSAISESCADMVNQALIRAAAQQVPTSFDVNYRPALWPDRQHAAANLAATAQQADAVLVGLDEAHALWGLRTADQVRQHLPEPHTVVVKDGAVAATAYIGDSRVRVRALSVQVREPVGAGDAFAAGWIHGTLSDLDPAAALRLGHLLAAVALRSLDDYGDLTHPPDILVSRAVSGVDWSPHLAVTTMEA